MSQGTLLPLSERIGEQDLFYYLAGILVSRLVEYCDEEHNEDDYGDGTLEIIFSNRSQLNCVAMQEYCSALLNAGTAEIVEASTRRFKREQISALPHGKRAGLQVADASAGALKFFYEADSYGQYEDTHVRILENRFYHRGGTFIGAGLISIPGKAMVGLNRERQILDDIWAKKKAGTGPKDPTVDQTAAVRDLE